MSVPCLVSPIRMLETSAPAMVVSSLDGCKGIIVGGFAAEGGITFMSMLSSCWSPAGCVFGLFSDSRLSVANPFGEAKLLVKASEKLYLGRLSIGYRCC